nr:DUF2281 domain-containing protein [uncultured Albidiferax sp.]
MNAVIEQSLIAKIAALSPQQVAEVTDFVEFLAQRQAKQSAWTRLLAIAPALEAEGVEAMAMDDINGEVKAARAERRARLAASGTGGTNPNPL